MLKSRRKLLVLLMVAAFVMAFTLQAFAAAKVGFSQDDIRKELKKKYDYDYKPYIKGTKKLGFDPDKQLFQRIYYTISLKFVRPITNKDLIDGVFKEVGKLLKQANVSTTALSEISHEGNPMDAIVKVYGTKISPNIIRFACIRGMMEALDDPHSILMLPDDYSKMKESMSGGNFSGIGVFIMSDPDNFNWLTVSEPIEGTPAYDAGLQPGDIIIAVDGKTTKDEPIDLTVSRIRGPEGTKVKLTVKRKGVAKPFTVAIVRRFIHVSSVKADMLKDKIGYIKLRVYGESTGDEMGKALAELQAKGAKAIILDVRNNSGGLIDAAQDVCSKFLTSNTPIVSVVNRADSKRVMRSTGGSFTNIPMVLMVNELSASASEITAGALKDNNRATLIGARTFGKGSVQELTPIYGNSGQPAALKLTIALFYTPKGTKIDGQGLNPDIAVPQDVRDANIKTPAKDKQLQKAIQFLKTKI